MLSHRRTNNARALSLCCSWTSPAWHQSLTRNLLRVGIRTICPDRYSSAATCRLRDRSRLHVHYAKTATARDQGRGQEPYSGMKSQTSYCQFQLHSDQVVVQACLNAPEPAPGGENGVDDPNAVDSPEEPTSAHLPPQPTRGGMPGHMPPNYMPGVGMDPQQALAYSSYVQQQRTGQYLPPSGLQQHAAHQS